MADQQTKYIRGHADGNTKRVVATDFTPDRDGERIDPDGVELREFKRNPVMLFGHNHMNLPIGKATKIQRREGKITFEPKFSDSTQFSRDVKALWNEGVLKAVSIGFIPKEREGQTFTKSELIEISVVNVPSNPNALADAKSKGLYTGIMEDDDVKQVSGSRDLQTFPESQEWDEDGAVTRIREWAGGPDEDDVDFKEYKKAFAWRDKNEPERFSSYKLPFADVDNAGNLKAVWQGVVAAQAALLDADGESKIPENERRKAHNLLSVYYEKFNKEQPEFRSVTKQSSVDKIIAIVQDVEMDADVKQKVLGLLETEKTASHSTEEKHSGNSGSPDNGQVGATEDEEEKSADVADILHLALQNINRETNDLLKTVNYVQGKKDRRRNKSK